MTINDDLVLFKAPIAVLLAATRFNHAAWGKKTTVTEYIQRQQAVIASDMHKTHVHISWVLMHKQDAAQYSDDNVTVSDDQDVPILASCSTYIRPAKIKLPSREDELDIPMISVSSVFVRSKFRGRGYASTLMFKLRNQLCLDEYKSIGLSNLYSDIGPKYYAQFGWIPFPSLSLQYKEGNLTDETLNSFPTSTKDVELLNQEEIKSILNTLNPLKGNNNVTSPMVALPFDPATFDWFVRSSSFSYTLASYKHPRGIPTIKGARTSGQSQSGLVVWDHYPALEMLYLLHLRATSVEELQVLLTAAQNESKLWNLHKIEAYLSHEHEQLKSYKLPMGWQVLPREDSLSSLMMWENGKLVDRVDSKLIWIGNERYGWV